MAITTNKVIKEMSESSLAKAFSIDFMICKGREDCASIIEKIKPGQTISFASHGLFNLHNLVIGIAEKFKPAEIHCTSFALRELPVRQLILAMQAGYIKNITMVIDKRAKIRTPDVYRLAEMNFCRIFQEEIHAKVTVLRTPAGYITIIGSQNWTTNPKIEAGVIIIDDETGIFHQNWIDKLANNDNRFK